MEESYSSESLTTAPLWRYLTPSPRSWPGTDQFTPIASETEEGEDSLQQAREVSSSRLENISSDFDLSPHSDATDKLWIPDSLARHMGINKIENNKLNRLTLTKIKNRIYANDEDIFMCVESSGRQAYVNPQQRSYSVQFEGLLSSRGAGTVLPEIAQRQESCTDTRAFIGAVPTWQTEPSQCELNYIIPATFLHILHLLRVDFP